MVMLSPRREVGEFRKRYKWMALVALLAFLVLLVRVVQLQLLQHDRWASVATENITKTIRLDASRGVVRDTRGRIVATNRPSYNVYITPQLLAEGDIDRVAELMGLDAMTRVELARRVTNVPLRRRTHQIEMFRDITRDQLAALQTHQNDLPAVDVSPRHVRTYPYGALGAHAVGYLNEVNAEDLERLGEGSGYRARDTIGRMGVERGWEDSLRGSRGYRRVLVDARGQRQRGAVALAQTQEEVVPPSPGHDIVLSLDMELMRTIQNHFNEPAGSVVVVDVNTGRVRALYSKPAYDLNDISGGMSHAAYAELSSNPFRPLIDKTIYETYYPGSTYKPVSALAALDGEIIDPSERVECIGYYQIGTDRPRCTSAHGDVDMRQALVQSCNVYFYALGEQVGLERLNRYGREFGFGTAAGIGINSEARGFLASRQWYIERFGRFRVGETLNAAIGQGNTRVTLLQLALAYGALANGGDLYKPQLIESVREPDGTLVEEMRPEVRHHIAVDDELLDYVNEGLHGVVNAQSGTAYDARIDGGIEISGKTGTAEIRAGTPRTEVDERRAWYFRRSHAWFAGFAPSENPEVAIVVLVEHGGSGGRAAAPIAIRILQDYLGGNTTTAQNLHGGP
ncbi:MAG: penicillin-binding protein 2 [Myxococcota bacterium]